ncbi:MAG: elongation factor P [Planctomycetota bacterium]
MLTTSEFKRGVLLEIEGDPFIIMDVSFQSPSARGATTMVKAKIRNLRTQQVFDKSFRSGDKVKEPNFEKRPIQYLYKDPGGYHFMDQQSYEQFSLTEDDMGDALDYLTDGLEGIQALVFNEKVIGIELPAHVTLRVVECEPAIKGATAQARAKPATLETGKIVPVPEYLAPGELIRVDTRDGRYVERVKE